MITLVEMKEGMSDKVAKEVINTFIRKSEILEMLPFDDAVSTNGSGSTLTYGYMQKKLPSTTGFRALGAEYAKSTATVEKKTADLKVLGGAFEIDRVINDAAGMYNNMQFQIDEKIESAIGTFHNGMINGDSASVSDSFDGLDKFLVGTTSEYGVDAVIDLSSQAAMTANSNQNANTFYEALINLINKTGAQAILVNEGMKTKIQTVARILGYKTESEEAFGRTVTTIGEGKVRIIDLKNVVTVSGDEAVETPIISGSIARTVDSVAQTGLTDIYAVRFGVLDGFLGVTLTGNSAIKTFLPDFKQPGAVKTGEVEMVAAVALKNTKAAGVLRNIKIQ